MSEDNLDAALSAAYDNINGAGGESLIDTSGDGVIHSDTRAKPGERADFFNETGGAWEAELAKAHDRSEERQRFEENSKAMPDRVGESISDRLDRSFDHVKRLETEEGRAQVQMESAAHLVVKQKIEMARQFNLDIMSADGKTVDVTKLQALDGMLTGNTGNTAAPPSEAIRQFVPDARTAAEAEQRLIERAKPYFDLETDYAQRGPRAILDAAHSLGHTGIVDVSDPRTQIAVAANYLGRPDLADAVVRQAYDDARREAAEHYAAAQQQHDPNAAVVSDWGASKPDFEHVRQEMGEMLAKNPELERTAGSKVALLETLYKKVQQARKRSGKSNSDMTVERVAAQKYKGAA